jgi:CRP-like cAMP-binding protein
LSTAQEARPPTENRLLATLPKDEYARLAPHLERVHLHHGQVLYNAGERIRYIYFPISAMISLVARLPDGSGVEVGVTGFEGMTGISVVMGVEKSYQECVVQIHDGGMRMSAEVLKSEFKRGGALQALLLRYAHSLMSQVSQCVACNRLHTVEERLARWLLMSYDRCVCDDLPLTHEFLSQMLGARRAGVTEAAIILQAEGLIHYRRGHIQITDRSGLQEFACECYPIIKAEFNRLTR